MIIRARQVVTMNGPIENGAVAIEDNRIAAVGMVGRGGVRRGRCSIWENRCFCPA